VPTEKAQRHAYTTMLTGTLLDHRGGGGYFHSAEHR